jgi:site-specific recombinase XerD
MDPLGPDPLIRSFERHLYAENRSARTVTTYLIAARQADTFLREHGASLEAATRGDLEAFLGDLLSRRKASTAATYHKVLKILYGWLAEEEEIPANPMAKIKKPIVPEQPVPIVPEEALKRLFQACAGNTFEARRDTALLMLLLDTGARRAEMVGIKLADVDLELDVLLVLGKGRRERTLPFGRRAGQALDRYLRARTRHRFASLPWLWLGQNGRLTDTGLRMMLRRRGAQVGLPGLHPHQLRHTFAHEWLAQGGTEGDLIRGGGWNPRAALQRYGASAADARAREAIDASPPPTGSEPKASQAEAPRANLARGLASRPLSDCGLRCGGRALAGAGTWRARSSRRDRQGGPRLSPRPTRGASRSPGAMEQAPHRPGGTAMS